MLNVIMLIVVMLNVVVPYYSLDHPGLGAGQPLAYFAAATKGKSRKHFLKGRLSTVHLLIKIACFVKNLY